MSFRDWDIFADMARLRRGLGRLEADGQAGLAQTEQHWCPAVDIYEQDDALVLLVDLPGVRKEDIELRLDANVLTLEGQRRREQERTGVRLERVVGRFARSFRIGMPIAGDQVQAVYREGVLEIVLPKGSRVQPERVRVAVE